MDMSMHKSNQASFIVKYPLLFRATLATSLSTEMFLESYVVHTSIASMEAHVIGWF
jgi:hypothetical protein